MQVPKLQQDNSTYSTASQIFTKKTPEHSRRYYQEDEMHIGQVRPQQIQDQYIYGTNK